MIKVTYHNEHYRVTIAGHAHSGDVGHDLVAAAVSILSYTLAADLELMEARGQLRSFTADMQPGQAEIYCTPVRNMQAIVSLVFDSVCTGFSILAKDYPQNICMKVFGG